MQGRRLVPVALCLAIAVPASAQDPYDDPPAAAPAPKVAPATAPTPAPASPKPAPPAPKAAPAPRAAPTPRAAPSPAPPKAAPKAAPPAELPPSREASIDDAPVFTQEQKDKAKERFLRGVKLLDEQAWAPALAEFLASRELFPTRVATNNAAVTLRRLQRYDEALDMFETLLRDFKLPDAEREAAQKELAELRSLVGTIEIVGAEAGASISITGADRGEYPPVKPLRVPSGTHTVRIFKAGYEPFETRTDVAGGRIAVVDVKLKRLVDSGTLRVTERGGKNVKVLVDNVAVGTTPWSGTVGVGPHVVALSGGGKLGSQPAEARVVSQQTTDLALVVEALDASLRVNPTPPGAAVLIDSVNVGNGVWLGRLRTGAHKLEVRAEGFLSASRAVDLKKGGREIVDIALERDEDAPAWRKPSNWMVDASAGLLIVPSFGGKIASDCASDCTSSVGLGALALVHGGYELGSGLGFGVEVGGLIASQEVTGRSATLSPVGFPTPTFGVANDQRRLFGFLGGATIGYRVGEQFPARFRVGVGVMQAKLRDVREGTFEAQQGGTFTAPKSMSTPSATYVYVDPTASVGYRLGPVELALDVKALMLIGVVAPHWDDSIELAAGSDGVGTYPADDVLGSFVVGVEPGLSVRYTH